MQQGTDKRLSRRNFLFGKPSKSNTISPPWAHKLQQNCTRCGDCLSACPEGIIKYDAQKLPYIDFHQGECTFCGDCANACNEQVFDQSTKPWKLLVTINKHCFLEQKVYCRSCGDACTENVLRFKPQLGGSARILFNFAACTGCGACVDSCPQNAVSLIPQTTDHSQNIEVTHA